MNRPHKQSDFLIGYPVPDEDRGEKVAIGLMFAGAALALIALVRFA